MRCSDTHTDRVRQQKHTNFIEYEGHKNKTYNTMLVLKIYVTIENGMRHICLDFMNRTFIGSRLVAVHRAQFKSTSSRYKFY